MSAIEIHWMTNHNLPDVLRIERDCFESPWTEEDFVQTLRQGNCIGTEMVDKLKTKLSQQRRHTLIVDVRETNLAAQLLWRVNGFEWSQTLRGHYDDEDAYQFRYRSAAEQFRPRNRISEFLQGVE